MWENMAAPVSPFFSYGALQAFITPLQGVQVWGGVRARAGKDLSVLHVCTIQYIRTYIHTFHGSMCHTEAVTSHKYTYTDLQCQIQQTFYKNILNQLYT